MCPHPRPDVTRSLANLWYEPSPAVWPLIPLSWLFCAAVWLRRRAYRIGLLRAHRLPVPVIVVGNISVGGTGKTPLVVWLVGHLSRAGFRPGVISRGYGGDAESGPRRVQADSRPESVGDEALLITRRTGCPTVVSVDRPAAARRLLNETDCNLIVSDDGLQHYALERDVEIVVIDGRRRFGNGHCLPAGPLREPPGRLAEADMVVCNGDPPGREYRMDMQQGGAINLVDPLTTARLADFAAGPVHALAGIGNPERFFALLRWHGLKVTEHAFPDHHPYTRADLPPDDGRPVLMTEKDAVKCEPFAERRLWFVPIDAVPDRRFIHRLDGLLKDLPNG